MAGVEIIVLAFLFRSGHKSGGLRRRIHRHTRAGKRRNGVACDPIFLHLAVNNNGQCCQGGFRRAVVRLAWAAEQAGV